MSFQDELEKLTRMRRAYLRFARELNTDGPWSGDDDRRYGKTPDPLAAIPVAGTVEAFGTFHNQLANNQFQLEIPSVETTLFDPVNEWRALGDRPSHLLLNRRLGFYLRQHEDDGNILDQLIAVGQVASPAFPPGRVKLHLKVPGGDFLGENVGRRLVTTRDWPRAHPDVLGKVVPFVYGRLSNTPPSTTIVGAPISPTCSDLTQPSGDIANPGGYTIVGASSMTGATNDPLGAGNVDDSYVQSSTSPASEVAVVRLAAATLLEGAVADLRVRAGGVGVTLTVQLRQGYVSESSQGTLIASWTQALTGSMVTYTFTLSEAQVAAITNPADLYVRWSMTT